MFCAISQSQAESLYKYIGKSFIDSVQVQNFEAKPFIKKIYSEILEKTSNPELAATVAMITPEATLKFVANSSRGFMGYIQDPNFGVESMNELSQALSLFANNSSAILDYLELGNKVILVDNPADNSEKRIDKENKENLQAILSETTEGSGLKLTNSASFGYNSVQYQVDESGDPVVIDGRLLNQYTTDGRLAFNSGEAYDPNIEFIKTGDKVEFSIEQSELNKPIDEVSIKATITTTINGKEVKVNTFINTAASLDASRLVNESNSETGYNKLKELNKIKDLRANLVNTFRNNPKAIITSSVSAPLYNEGNFGHLNLAAEAKSVTEYMGNNLWSPSNPNGYVVTFIDAENKPVLTGDYTSLARRNIIAVEGVTLKPGRAVVLVPNMYDDKTRGTVTEYFPAYLNINTIDKHGPLVDLITSTLKDLIENYNSNGKSLPRLRGLLESYLFIKSNLSDLGTLTKSSLFINEDNNSTSEQAGGVTFNFNTDQFRTFKFGETLNEVELRKFVSSLRLNLNEDLLNGFYEANGTKHNLTLTLNELLDSGVITTKIHTNLQGPPTYFTQHTKEFSTNINLEAITPEAIVEQIVEETNPVVELPTIDPDTATTIPNATQVELPNTEDELDFEDMDDRDGIAEDISILPNENIVEDINIIPTENITIKDAPVFSNKKTEDDFIQGLAILAFNKEAFYSKDITKEMLNIESSEDSTQSNKDTVRSILERILEVERNNLAKAQSNLDKATAYLATNPTNEININKSNNVIERATKIINNELDIIDSYEKVLIPANFDTYFQMAQDRLSDFGVQADESGDYDNYVEEGNTEQFNEAGNETTDYIEQMPKEVKRLLALIPDHEEVIVINPTTQEQEKKILPKISGVRLNRMGDVINNYNKILAITTENYYDNNLTGEATIVKMINDIRNSNDPNLIILANKLENLWSRKDRRRTVIQFANNVIKAFAQYKTLLVREKLTQRLNVEDSAQLGREVYDTWRRISNSLIDSNDTQAKSTIYEGLKVKFFNRGIQNGFIKNQGGYSYIDLGVITPVVEELRVLLDDESNYTITEKKTRAVTKKIHTIKNEAMTNLIDKLDWLGIVLSENKNEAKEILYTYLETNQYKGDNKFNLAMLLFANPEMNVLSNTGQFSILGTLTKTQTDLAVQDLFRNNDIFQNKQNFTGVINSMYTKFKDSVVGGFKKFGKSYYPILRPSYISNIFQKIKSLKGDFKARKIDSLFPNMKDDILRRQTVFFTDPSNIDLSWEKGSRFNNGDPFEITDNTPRDFENYKLRTYMSSGNIPWFVTDTYSDKTPKPLVRLFARYTVPYNKETGYKLDANNKGIQKLVLQASAELDRIKKTIKDSDKFKDQPEKLFPGYHDIKTKEGIAKFFVLFPFLNNFRKELLDENTNDSMISGLLSTAIIDHMKTEIDKQRNVWLGINMLTNSKGKVSHADFLLGSDFVQAWAKNTNMFSTQELAQLNNPYYSLNERNEQFYTAVFENILAEYTMNNFIASQEMLMMTGDPAFASKISKATRGKKLTDETGDIINMPFLMKAVSQTANELSKRNASFMANGDVGLYYRSNYNLAVANGININSRQFEIYNQLLTAGSRGNYQTGEQTDAQEMITVKESLERLIADGQITPEEYVSLLNNLAPTHFKLLTTGKLGNTTIVGTEKLSEHPTIGYLFTEEYKERLDSVLAKKYEKGSIIYDKVVNIQKPVHRQYIWDDALKLNYEIYVKSSALPLLEGMVAGSPLGTMLQDMYTKDVQRVAFASAVKQGARNPKDIFNEDGSYNSEFLTANIQSIPSEAYKKQLDTNFDEGKHKITEGSQDSVLFLVDVLHDQLFTLDGSKLTGQNIKDKYVSTKQRLYEINKAKLLARLGTDDSLKFRSLSDVSKWLIDEYKSDSPNIDPDLEWQLSINPATGDFNVPLTFFSGNQNVQSKIMSLFNKGMVKAKMPGRSAIQSSEVLLNANRRDFNEEQVKELSDLSKSQKSKITFISEEYKTKSKLDYIRILDKEGNELASDSKEFKHLLSLYSKMESGDKSVNEELSDYTLMPAEIVVPNLFIDENDKQIDLTKIVDENGNIDPNKVPKELLELYGFRIPYQSPNSGLWFKIVGFLPKELGEMAIVPGEIAAQMGSDYDVDKLFLYFKHYKINSNENGSIDSIVVETEDEYKVLQNDIIDLHKAVYNSVSALKNILNPQEVDLNKKIIALFESKKDSSEQEGWITPASPTYQSSVYFDNRGGQQMLGIYVAHSILHAHLQNTNGFIDTPFRLIPYTQDGSIDSIAQESLDNSVKQISDSTYSFRMKVGEDEQGRAIYETMTAKDLINSGGLWRLDKITDTIGNKISGNFGENIDMTVDNAKDKLLSKVNLNLFNVGVDNFLKHLGLDEFSIKILINQPILLSYYSKLQGSTKYTSAFTGSLKDEAVLDILTSIDKRFPNEKLIDFYNEIDASSITVDLRKGYDALFTNPDTMDLDQIKDQLVILKEFQRADSYSDVLNTMSSRTSVNRKGLTKTMVENAQQVQNINKLREGKYTGPRVHNFIENLDNTILDTFIEVPTIVNNIFGSTVVRGKLSPLYAHNTPAYLQVMSDLQKISGKEEFNIDQLNLIYNEIKRYIITGTDFGLYKGLDTNLIKAELLNSTETNKSIFEQFNEIKTLGESGSNSFYRNNKLVQFINLTVDPETSKYSFVLLDSARNNMEEIKIAWAEALRTDVPGNELLREFANKLIYYSFLVNSNEFAYSNMLRYVPLQALKFHRYPEFIRSVNSKLNDPEVLTGFIEQFLLHEQGDKFIQSVGLGNDSHILKLGNGKSDRGITEQGISWFRPSTEFMDRELDIVKSYVDGNKVIYKYDPTNGLYIQVPVIGDLINSNYNFNIINKEVVNNPLPNSVPTGQSVDDLTIGDFLSKNPNTVQVLDWIENNSNNNLFRELSKSINRNTIKSKDLNFTYAIDNSLNANGRTTYADKSVVINVQGITNSFKNNPNKVEQVVLHEFLHNIINITSQENQDSIEFQGIKQVWNEYRKNILRDNDTSKVRGISNSSIEAVLFEAIVNQYKNKRDNSDFIDIYNLFTEENISSNWSELKDYMESSLDKYARQGLLSSRSTFKFNDNSENPQSNDVRDYIINTLSENAGTTEDPNKLINFLKGWKDKYYGFYNVGEFISEAFTNPNTQTYLQTMDSTKSFWDKLMEGFKKVLSSIFGIKRSLLNDTLEGIINYTQVNFANDVVNTGENTTFVETNPPWEETLPMVPNQQMTNPVNSTIVTQGFNYTFPDGVSIDTDFQLSSEQQDLMISLYNWYTGKETSDDDFRNMYMIQGSAGSGKSSSIKYFMKYLHATKRITGDQIGLSSPSHKANKVLYKFATTAVDKFGRNIFNVTKDGYENNVFTTQAAFGARLIYDRRAGITFDSSQKPTSGYGKLSGSKKWASKRLWIIDEVSMLSEKPAKMAEVIKVLKSYANDFGIKIIFMGDNKQLKGVETNQLSSLFDLVPNKSVLVQEQRQAVGNPILETLRPIKAAIDGKSKDNPLSVKVGTYINETNKGIIYTNDLSASQIELFTSGEYDKNRQYAKIIARSNVAVTNYNNKIRGTRFNNPSLYEVGDTLMGYQQTSTDSTIYNGQEYIVQSVQYDQMINIKDELKRKLIEKGQSSLIVKVDELIQDGNLIVHKLIIVEDNPLFKASPVEINISRFKDNIDVDNIQVLLNNIKVLDSELYKLREQKNLIWTRKDLSNSQKWGVSANITGQIENLESLIITLSNMTQFHDIIYKSKTSGEFLNDKQITEELENEYASMSTDPRFYQLIQDAKEKRKHIDKSIDYGYAVTNQKAQGSTYKNAIVDLDTIEGKSDFWFKQDPDSALRNQYVAISRASDVAYLISSDPFTNTNDINQVEETDAPFDVSISSDVQTEINQILAIKDNGCK